MQTDFDVLIVGGGMVGLSLATSLGQNGFKTLLIEGNTIEPDALHGASGFEPRVSAITQASRAWLDKLDVWSNIPNNKISPFTTMEVWDAEGTGEVRFDATDVQTSSLGYIIENREIQLALIKSLKDTPVQVIEKTKLVGIELKHEHGEYWNQITLDDGYSFSCKLVVGADGQYSKVRELSELESFNWEYNHQAIVTTITTELPHNQCARQSFAPEGPLGILPLPGEDQRHCSIVWSATPEFVQLRMAEDDDAFCKAVTRATESRLGKVTAVDQRHAIPLAPGIAKTYVKEGIALVGDAAHRIHPLAGQGVNLGFLDAQELSNTLSQAIKINQSPGSEFQLRKYQRNRQAHNLAMTAAMEGFKRLFESDDLAVRLIRNLGMKHFNQIPFIKNEVMRFAMGTHVDK